MELMKVPFFRMPSGLSTAAVAVWGSAADMMTGVEESQTPKAEER